MFSGGQKETLGKNRLEKNLVTHTVFSQELKKLFKLSKKGIWTKSYRFVLTSLLFTFIFGLVFGYHIRERSSARSFRDCNWTTGAARECYECSSPPLSVCVWPSVTPLFSGLAHYSCLIFRMKLEFSKH